MSPRLSSNGGLWPQCRSPGDKHQRQMSFCTLLRIRASKCVATSLRSAEKEMYEMFANAFLCVVLGLSGVDPVLLTRRQHRGFSRKLTL